MKTFGEQLKSWRTLRGCSQMQLASDLSMSSRNISFLETGRSRPTKSTITRLVKYLEIPVREQNNLLTAAGLSALNNDRTLNDADVQPFYNAISQMLINHSPYPALVFNRWWDIIDLNENAKVLLQGVDQGDNIIQKCFLDEEWRVSLDNWQEILWQTYYELRSELCNYFDARYQNLYLDVEKVVNTLPQMEISNQPVICSRYIIGGKTLNLTNMVTRFRSPQDVNLSEMKLELIFPADTATEAIFKSADFPESLINGKN